MTCYIFGAAPHGTEGLIPEDEDLIIAADGGLVHTARLGILPHVVIGDFDSLGYVPGGAEVVRLPVEKDMTDLAAAVELGISRGYHRFVFYGATGGRPDHTMANYQLLASLSSRGAEAYLVGDDFSVTAISDGSALTFDEGFHGTLSVFAHGGEARGVTETGTYYTLTDACLTSAVPLGVSNAFTGREAQISVREGILLVMWEGQRLPKKIIFP